MKKYSYILVLVTFFASYVWFKTSASNEPERVGFIEMVVRSTIEPREQDLPMTLPFNSSNSSNSSNSGGEASAAPLSIVIDDSDQIKVNDVGGFLSMREFRSLLKRYVTGCISLDVDPIVHLYLAPESTQKRAMDILNELKGADISEVNFTKE